MAVSPTIHKYQSMRTQALWRLLAAEHGPVILGLLQAHLYDRERSQPVSVFHQRIEQDLEGLRADGQKFPQTSQAYVADWLAQGYLERRFPAGASEEQYELSAASVAAIRFISQLDRPHSTATESRLSVVINELVRLAEDTDADQSRRLERLQAERDRLDRQMDDVRSGRLRVVSPATALERVREIIALADTLGGDFHRVRDEFEKLNRSLREEIVSNEGSRGHVLDSLFAGMDLISESPAGCTFNAFWRLLTDPEQGAVLEEALESVMSRPFFGQLEAKDRSFLRKVTSTLLEEGQKVHEVQQAFAHGLKQFVQSREYLEQRRLHQLLREAQKMALDLKEQEGIRVFTELPDYHLWLTSCNLRSLSQWVLYDPSLQAPPGRMADGDPPTLGLDAIGELLAQSEIDFRTLRANILSVLEARSQATIADILEAFPARQGLGSVVGLLALGSRYGLPGDGVEGVAWSGHDGQSRRAKVPRIYFTREKSHAMV